MDGKRRISIVIFLNCIQVISRMKHRKPENKAASQEQRFLIGFWFLALTAIYGWRKTGKDNNPLSVKAPSAFNAVVMVVACIPTSICHSIEQRAPSRFHYDKMLSHPYCHRRYLNQPLLPDAFQVPRESRQYCHSIYFNRSHSKALLKSRKVRGGENLDHQGLASYFTRKHRKIAIKARSKWVYFLSRSSALNST